jgi:ectoine hydroxylase-related dioxygenase (phytanoyl-CoA dioxygenase family)
MVSHLQRITLRRGEAVIWNVLTAHATFPNTSNVPRIVQYVRMMPATSDSEARDRYAAPSMLKTDKVVLDSLKTIQLTDAQKRLLGLMPWPK